MEFWNEKRKEKLDEMLEIPGAERIRGNIFLPESAGVASEDAARGDLFRVARITWKSSAPEVISAQKLGDKAAGVVHRGEQDLEVTLHATAVDDFTGEIILEKEQKVRVVKAPGEIKEEDYAGYLFGHFIGEGAEDQEQIYFAVSEDGLHFTDMNGCKPVLISEIGEKGVRDPFLCRSAEGDRFFLIATDLSIYHRGGWFQNEQGYYDASTTGSPYLVLWQSDDLVHWEEPRLIRVAPENAGMAWAPEMVYYEKTGEYILFFASSIMDPATKYKSKPNAIYYVTTRDFMHFSETKLFIDNQTDGAVDGKPREIIDTTVLRVGDVYYSVSKDGDNSEANGGIRLMKSMDLLNPASWEKVLDLDELGLDTSALGIPGLDNGSLEGPELFRFNKRDWADPAVPEYGILADQYMIGAGYLPLKTTNLEDARNAAGSWRLLDAGEYSFDKLKKRHGTILCITADELAALKKLQE